MEEDTWSEDCHAELLEDKPTLLACDSETEGLAWKDRAFGVSFAWYVGEDLRSGYIDMRYHNDLWLEVKAWIKHAKPTIVGHNWKYDSHKLGLYPNDFHDTCLMVYLLNEHYPKGLKVLAEKILKETTDEAEVLKETRRKLKLKISDGYDKLPLEVVAPYAIRDAEYTLKLYLRLADKIAAEEELAEVYTLERQLLLCVAGTERRGMGIDLEYVKGKIIEYGDKILALEREASEIVGKPIGRDLKTGQFNLDSPKQLQEYFASVGVELPSTSKEVLGSLSHPLAAILNKIRAAKKIRATYLLALADEVVWDEELQMWVLHPNWNLTKAKTLRSTSSGAND